MASESLFLDIAGIRFALHGLSFPLASALRDRFLVFLAESPSATPDLSVTVLPSEIEQYLPSPSEGGPLTYQLLTEFREGRLHLRSYCFEGALDLPGRNAEIRLCAGRRGAAGSAEPMEPPPRSVENFLRVALSWKAVDRGGLLLHASGVVRAGRAYLFFGPSGAGKTTIARLSPEELLLNDDCILILPEADGFTASGVPFKGAEDAGARDAGSFPIAGLFRLVQAPVPACSRLAPARGASEILSSIPFVTERPEGFERVFTTVEQLVRRAPVYRLEFRRDPDFWPVIERELARG